VVTSRNDNGDDKAVYIVIGPVQFERDEEDPFGLDQFLDTAKRASGSNKRGIDDRDRKEKDGKRSRKDY
jgi:SNW domain-containing protein 1